MTCTTHVRQHTRRANLSDATMKRDAVKQKYQMQWLEYHNPDDTETLNQRLKSLPNAKVIGKTGDNITILAIDNFTAKNDKDAMKYVSEHHWDVDNAFSVKKNGKEVFTEETIED